MIEKRNKLKNYKISVIVPVFNAEMFLDKCINSIIDQTYKNLEIILIDDGSKDNSLVLCNEYAYKDNRIKVIHKENGGVSSARNTGLDNCVGDLVAFVDSDDYLEPNTYEKCVDLFAKKQVDMVRYSLIQENNVKKKAEKIQYDKSSIYPKDEILGWVLDYKLLGNVYCWIVKKELIQNTRFNENIHLRGRFII